MGKVFDNLRRRGSDGGPAPVLPLPAIKPGADRLKLAPAPNDAPATLPDSDLFDASADVPYFEVPAILGATPAPAAPPPIIPNDLRMTPALTFAATPRPAAPPAGLADAVVVARADRKSVV